MKRNPCAELKPIATASTQLPLSLVGPIRNGGRRRDRGGWRAGPGRTRSERRWIHRGGIRALHTHRWIQRRVIGHAVGAGAGIRTPDPRFKSSPRTPQDASSRLLLYSILRISPPRGTSWHPGLAIQIGYISEGNQRTTCTRLSTPRHLESAVRTAEASVTRPTARTRASGSLSDLWRARSTAAILATSRSIGWTVSTTESTNAFVRLTASLPRRLAPTSTSANALAGR